LLLDDTLGSDPGGADLLVRRLDVAARGLERTPGLGNRLADGPTGILYAQAVDRIPLRRGPDPGKRLPPRKDWNADHRRAGQRPGVGIGVQRAGKPAVAQLALKGDGGHLLGPGPGDPSTTGLLSVLRRPHNRAAALGQIPGLLDGGGQEGADWGFRGKSPGSLPNHGLVTGARGRKGGLGGVQEGDGGRETGLGLGYVCSRNLAHFEPGAGLIKLTLKDGDVGLANSQRLLVAADVDIGLDHLAEDLRLDATEAFTTGQAVRLGRRDRRGHPPARVHRLGQ